MNVGVLVSETSDFPVSEVKKRLAEKGYDLSAVVSVDSTADFAGALTYLQSVSQAIVVCGACERFFETVRDRYRIDEHKRVFQIDEISYALCERYEMAFITDTVIPLLNSRCKTFYSTVQFRTFGKTESELRELLKEQIRNRNRIAFHFYPSLCACDVAMRYSNKMMKSTVDDMVSVVAEKLKDCTYGFGDMTLAETVVDLLKVRGKKVCLAESFTGGAIASKLVAIPGASEALYEGLVCYNAQAKAERLGIDSSVIEHYGAVSDETVYEMAAGLLMQGHCDFALATTGNAGPTAEREGDEGHCYISVGDAQGIHIYEYRFTGTRAEVIESGTQNALFMLYKALKHNEFESLLQQQEQLQQDNEKN
ncbi:MAG: CinA family protein [Clostridia bacterium]|jgi:PncC family amidohydrolase|nr:CinA family protein [Clostridia bacterium]